MNTNFLKTFILAIQTVFLTIVKKAIKIAKSEAIASAKTYTDTKAGQTLQSAKDYTDLKLSQLDVLGEYKGSGATMTELSAITGVGNKDVVILTAKDGTNKPGIYVYNSTTSAFEFVIEIKSADAQALVDSVLSKIGDLSTLNTTEKTTLVGAINEILAKFDDYALKNGNVDNHFLVKDAEAQTKQAVNASQFDFTFTEAEAQAAWDAINVDEPAYNFDVRGNWSGKNVTSSATFLSYLVNTCGSPDATVSDFSLVGNRLRAIVTNCPNIFLKNMSLESTDFKVPNYSGGYALLDISENNLSLVDIDAIADFALANLPSLSTWKSFDNTQPTESKKTALTALCTANDGSAFFAW